MDKDNVLNPLDGETERGLAEMSVEPNKAIARSKNGQIADSVVVTFDRKALEEGYGKPFEIVVNDKVDREILLDSVRGKLAEVSEDPKNNRLRGQFINWFCKLFGYDNTVFDTKKILSGAVDNIVDHIEKTTNAKERLVPSEPLETISVSDVGGNDERYRT